MLVRHDAQVKVTARCSVHGKHEDIVDVGLLDAHLTVAAATHGKVSGYDSGVEYKYKLAVVHPEKNILKNGQECPCPRKELHS